LGGGAVLRRHVGPGRRSFRFRVRLGGARICLPRRSLACLLPPDSSFDGRRSPGQHRQRARARSPVPRTNGRTNCAAPRRAARTAPYSPGRHGSTREQSQCLPAPFVFAPHPDCHCQPPALDPLPVLALLLTPLSFSCHRSRRRRLSIVLAPWIFIHPYFRTPEPKQIEHAWLYILQQGVVRHDAKKKKTSTFVL
jgi:hypothetical protein